MLKKIHAEFFKTRAGNEPVREVLQKLGRPAKTVIGEDIRFVELNWRVDRPYVDRIRSGSGEHEKTIYEVRHKVESLEYRTLFFVYGSRMILVHCFHKSSQKTPKVDVDLGWERMKQWILEQRHIESLEKKKVKGKK